MHRLPKQRWTLGFRQMQFKYKSETVWFTQLAGGGPFFVTYLFCNFGLLMVVDRLVYPTLLACGGPFCLPRFLTVTVLLGGALLQRQGVTHVLLHVPAASVHRNVVSYVWRLHDNDLFPTIICSDVH